MKEMPLLALKVVINTSLSYWNLPLLLYNFLQRPKMYTSIQGRSFQSLHSRCPARPLPPGRSGLEIPDRNREDG